MMVDEDPFVEIVRLDRVRVARQERVETAAWALLNGDDDPETAKANLRKALES